MSLPMGFGPGGIDCGEVLEEVFLYLDDEADRQSVRERIRQHLDACAPCFRQLRARAGRPLAGRALLRWRRRPVPPARHASGCG